MHFEIIYVVLAILGLLLHVGFKLQTRSNKTESFSYKYWLKDNWLDVSLAVLSVITILLMMDEIMLFMGITTIEDNDMFYKMTSFFAGFFNVRIIRDLKQMFLDRKS